MEKRYTQNFENHARYIFSYHVVTLGIFTINLIWSLYRAATSFSWDSLLSGLLAVAFLLFSLRARTMALTVQDRVIRLEERLRMERLLPADLQSRLPEFTLDQLVALRFASDDELPALARRVLDERPRDRKAIKKMIRTWRPDFLRA
jgi:hypothetical protein